MPATTQGPFFGLDVTQLPEFTARALTRSFPSNTMIFSAGDDTDALYVILSGKVRVFVANEHGKEVTLAIAGPGEYFGELTLDGGARSASVITVEPSQLMIVRRHDVEVLLATHPDFAIHLVRKLIHRIRTLTDRVRSLAL